MTMGTSIRLEGEGKGEGGGELNVRTKNYYFVKLKENANTTVCATKIKQIENEHE